jgi:hypothetical protein
MKRTACAVAFALLSGCSTFSTQEASVGCQAADAVTTVAALSAGATEANPLVAGVIGSTGIAGFIAFKALVALTLYYFHDDAVKTETGETALAATNGITCGAALNNLLLI